MHLHQMLFDLLLHTQEVMQILKKINLDATNLHCWKGQKSSCWGKKKTFV